LHISFRELSRADHRLISSATHERAESEQFCTASELAQGLTSGLQRWHRHPLSDREDPSWTYWAKAFSSHWLFASSLAGSRASSSEVQAWGSSAISSWGSSASWISPQFGIYFGSGIVSAIVDATIGAVLLLLIVRVVRGRSRWGGRWGGA
jgi:hypothetical protein